MTDQGIQSLSVERVERENQDLRRANARHEAASKAKDQFLAHMAHEIRTPMTSILGFAELLLEPGQKPAERDEALQSIRRNASHLSELINNVLDLSKIQAGQMTVERLACDLPELIHSAACLTRQAMLDKGLQFRVRNDGPLPRRIQTDPLRVRQILVNLISNAAKFTEKGGIELRISCRAPTESHRGCAIQFVVTDTGLGMTASQVARLFQPFSQAEESTARRFGGTGLGLAISKSLAGLLGGDITVRSEPGVGSTFTLEIDGGCMEGAETLDNIPDEPVISASAVQKIPQLHGRVLLAEDGLDNQRLIALRLRQVGADVVVVGDGRAALETLAAEPIDLVFMDLQMPVVDGCTAVARLRERGCRTPVVALTARASSADRERCMAAGFDDYLTKPIDKARLWDCVRHYLRESAAAAQRPLISELAEDPDLQDLLQNFVAILPDKMNELSQLLPRRDPAPLRHFAHQLNGAAGGYGFPDITRAAANLESLTESGADWNQIISAAANLAALIRRVDGYRDNASIERLPAA